MKYTLAIYILFLFCPLTAWQGPRPFSIMLDPAGDARTPGRMIGDHVERGITLEYVQELKTLLEQQMPDLRVVLTRFPGETIAPLQNANFANRLHVDLYLSIHFYQEKKDARSSLSMYQYISNPITDLWFKPQPLTFYSYDQAHLFSVTKTTLLAEQLRIALEHDRFRRLFDMKGFFKIPFKPLVGIQSPALAIEIGLKQPRDWRLFLEPLVYGITHLMV